MSRSLPFSRVFKEQSGSEETFPGFLLVNHGRQETADQKGLAWAYAQATLRNIDFGLDGLDHPEAAYPALFLARHTLELYLKGLVPDWNAERSKEKTAHHIDYLIDILHERLLTEYDATEVHSLAEFLRQVSMLDPKSMAFRYADGAVRSFGAEPLDDPEIWVDFQALRESLGMIFDALDTIWRKQTEAGF